jgi:hypothetical protein
LGVLPSYYRYLYLDIPGKAEDDLFVLLIALAYLWMYYLPATKLVSSCSTCTLFDSASSSHANLKLSQNIILISVIDWGRTKSSVNFWQHIT